MCCLVVIGCGKPEPKRFTTNVGGFTVLVPGEPKNKRSDDGTNVYWVRKGDNIYMVAYWTSDKEPTFEGMDVINRFGRGKFNQNRRLVEQNGLRGDELTLEVSGEDIATTSRDFHMPDRTFRIQTVYFKNRPNLMDPNAFLDSFELIE